MQFLHINECAEWCVERGAAVQEPFVLASDTALSARAVIEFATERSTGLEGSAVAACLEALGDWDECLLWVTLWGVWPSSEDWPAYYALRGVWNQRASLDEKPGHLCHPEHRLQLQQCLLAVLSNGWDAHLLPCAAGRITRRIFASHDGWVELRSRSPERFELGAVQHPREAGGGQTLWQDRGTEAPRLTRIS